MDGPERRIEAAGARPGGDRLGVPALVVEQQPQVVRRARIVRVQALRELEDGDLLDARREAQVRRAGASEGGVPARPSGVAERVGEPGDGVVDHRMRRCLRPGRIEHAGQHPDAVVEQPSPRVVVREVEVELRPARERSAGDRRPREEVALVTRPCVVWVVAEDRRDGSQGILGTLEPAQERRPEHAGGGVAGIGADGRIGRRHRLHVQALACPHTRKAGLCGRPPARDPACLRERCGSLGQAPREGQRDAEQVAGSPSAGFGLRSVSRSHARRAGGARRRRARPAARCHAPRAVLPRLSPGSRRSASRQYGSGRGWRGGTARGGARSGTAPRLTAIPSGGGGSVAGGGGSARSTRAAADRRSRACHRRRAPASRGRAGSTPAVEGHVRRTGRRARGRRGDRESAVSGARR